MKRLLATRFGFSLVELMIVVAIIGVLATIGIPTFRTMVQKAKKSEAKVALGALYTSETAFFSEYGTYGNLLDKVGFDLDGAPATRTYTTGFFAGNCQTAQSTASPSKTQPNGSALNVAFPAYYGGSQYTLAAKTTPASSAICGNGVPTDGSSFTAAASGEVSPKAGQDDIWTIDNNRALANVQDGVK